MGWEDQITEYLPVDFFLPAIAQGALGIEIREDDKEIRTIAQSLNHESTRLCVEAERAFLKKLGGSCQVPVAGVAQINDQIIKIEGLVGSIDGKKIIRNSICGNFLEGKELGTALAEGILSQGGDKILEGIVKK